MPWRHALLPAVLADACSVQVGSGRRLPLGHPAPLRMPPFTPKATILIHPCTWKMRNPHSTQCQSSCARAGSQPVLASVVGRTAGSQCVLSVACCPVCRAALFAAALRCAALCCAAQTTNLPTKHAGSLRLAALRAGLADTSRLGAPRASPALVRQTGPGPLSRVCNRRVRDSSG